MGRVVDDILYWMIGILQDWTRRRLRKRELKAAPRPPLDWHTWEEVEWADMPGNLKPVEVVRPTPTESDSCPAPSPPKPK